MILGRRFRLSYFTPMINVNNSVKNDDEILHLLTTQKCEQKVYNLTIRFYINNNIVSIPFSFEHLVGKLLTPGATNIILSLTSFGKIWILLYKLINNSFI